MAALRAHTEQSERALGLRDLARADYRVQGDRLVFLEMNALPGLASADAEIWQAARLAGLTSKASLLGAIVASALKRLRSDQRTHVLDRDLV